MDLLPGETALSLAKRLRNREVSAVELTRASFELIAKRDSGIHAFVELDTRRAVRAAERADRALAAGESVTRFLGVPTAIKDSEHMRMMGTRIGSRAFSKLRWPVDGMIAQRCRQGGFTLLGKLATSELTILPFSHTDIHPPTRNPIDPTRYSGGSSSGSSAAVASGMLPIAAGTDGAGSIRIPAAFCGLVGMKPGRGVLFHEHEVADAGEMTSVGPLAHDVRDAAAMLDVLDGRFMHEDKPSARSFLGACDVQPRGLRIRVGLSSPLADVDPQISGEVRRAANVLEAMGHHVDEGDAILAEVDEFLPMMARMVATVPVLPFAEKYLQPTTRWMRELGRSVSKASLLTRLATLERKVMETFGDADVWILPTTPVFAPKVGQFDHLDGEGVFRAVVPIGAFTAPFNVAGLPAISLPGRRSREGLPIGVQLVGRRGADRRLLGLAAALEEALR